MMISGTPDGALLSERTSDDKFILLDSELRMCPGETLTHP